MTRSRLAVATWPGGGQEYIRRFCESLRGADIQLEQVESPIDALSIKIDVLHIHWPEKIFWNCKLTRKIFNAVATILSLVVLKVRGVTLIWCVHNVQPHDASKALLIFWRYYIGAISRLIDGFVTLSPSTVDLVRQRLPNLRRKPAIFVWHPSYRIPIQSERNVRKRCHEEKRGTDTLLCFFGFAKRYKGIDDLIRCFTRTEDPHLRLGMYGLADEDTSQWLHEIAKRDPRVSLNLKWLSETELSESVIGSDIVVLPFKSILHSGSLIYALSCGRPVITPAAPYALDVQRMVGQEWVRTYKPPLSEAILISMSSKQRGRPNLDFLSTAESGKKLKQFYVSFRQKRKYHFL